MKHDFPAFGLGKLCGLFGKTRVAIYDYQKRLQSTELQAELVVQHVKQIRETLPRLGTRKLHFKLAPRLLEHNLRIGRDYLFDLLDRHQLLIRRRRRKIITTDSRHWMHKHSNKVQSLKITRPEQVWVSDITFIRLSNQWGYLSLITDAYSRKIMGYSFRTDMTTQGNIEALQMALSNRQYPGLTLIHHSDRGSQYCSNAYVGILEKNRITISMTQNGDPYENALAERMNGILKVEFNLYESACGFENTYNKIAASIQAYNEERPHSSCDMMVPSQAHFCCGELRKTWKKYPVRNRQTSSKKEAVPALSTEQGSASSFTGNKNALSSKNCSRIPKKIELRAVRLDYNLLTTV
jgi:transposase InsO family protein